MDAITLLKDDHKTVEKLFKRFEKAGDHAFVEKRETVDRIIEELSKHAAVEEMLFYPVTRATVPETDDIVLESIEEHNVVKWLLSELDKMDVEAENFAAKVTVLIENVRHHVKEEEDEYFPQVRDELGRKALNELGDAMASAKATAPTHPHPRSPSTPPANVVTGNVAGVADIVGDTVSGLAQGGVAAVADVVDRMRGVQTSRPRPQGSSTTRKTASSVRSGADEALDQAIGAVQQARDAGEESATRARTTATKTAKAAKTGAKRTAGSAKKGARNTATTAKQARTTTVNTAKKTAKKTAKSTAKKTAKRTTKAR